MSHFFVLVLMPDGAADVAMAVEDLLARYDENLNVGEYQKPCYCLRRGASLQAEEEAAARFGTLDQLRVRFEAQYIRPEELNPEESNWHRHDAWTEFLKDFIEFHEDRQRELLKSMKPDPECEDCNGTGVMTSTYNPDSQWDWWQIGGRWTGVLRDYDPETDPRNLETCRFCGGTGRRANPQDGSISECHMCDGTGQLTKWPGEWANYNGDMLPVRDLHLTTYPHAVVTPDGEWHQEAEVGWFGCTSCNVDPAQWTELVDTLLEKHCDCTAVVVDCHI
jgi:hypothetical protein